MNNNFAPTASLDGLPHNGNFMGPQIVHDDDIARLQRRRQHLLDVGQEEFAVDRAIDSQRRGQAVAAQCTDEGCGFPMPMRHGSDRAMAAFGPTIAPCHVGLYRGFVDENELRRGQLRLLLAPFDARLGNIPARLLGGVERLF
jgi:hypothetical protein